MSFVEIRNISASKLNRKVLHDTSFSIQKGERLAIAGETGSGKSTLLKIMAGLEQPDNGEVYFKGAKIPMPDDHLIPGIQAIRYVSQALELRNNYRVEEELDYTNELPADKAAEIFRICEVDHLLQRWTDELSGGERQRIVIARCLISLPEILLLDEPFSNADMNHKRQMKALLERICTEMNIASVLVSHDPNDTMPWADRMLILQNGAIIQDAPPQYLYRQPVNEFAAGLLGTFVISPVKIGTPFLMSAGKYLYRPDNWSFTDNPADETHEAALISREFFGSHWEVWIKIADTVFPVRTTQPPPNNSIVRVAWQSV